MATEIMRTASLIAIFLVACGADSRRTAVGDGLPPGTVDAGANPMTEPDPSMMMPDPGAPQDPDGNLDPPVYDECTKVDLLFVIDNSASMSDQQASLIASFDGFVQGMRDNLSQAESFHVGVVTTDDYRFNEAGCQNIGDLVTQTGGGDSSNRACGPFAEGGRFMSNVDADLSERFACAAQVGVFGNDDERVARAMLNAIKPENNAPGACNAGFVRDDSLLVIVLITDEDDVRDGCFDQGFGEECESYGSGGRGGDWAEELLQYRPNPDSTVVLGLFGETYDNECGALIAARLMGFTNRFGDNGYTGNVCAGSYDEFFRQALPVIDSACINLI